MNNKQITAILLIAVITVGTASVVYLFLNNGGNGISIIDTLYAESARVEGNPDSPPMFALADITYEMSALPGANITSFGSLADTQSIDGVGMGMIIDWTNVTESFINLAIVFMVPTQYTEKLFDLNPRCVFTINHTGSFDYLVSTIVQLTQITNETPSVFDFELTGNGTDYTVVDLTSSVIESIWYNATTEEGYFRPFIEFHLPIQSDYVTTIQVDYLGVDVT